MPRDHTSHVHHPVDASAKRPGLSTSLAVNAVAAALALLGAFLASGDARAQTAPAPPGAAALSPGGPGSESAISVSGQVSLVWKHAEGISAAVSNFSDGGTGAEATAEHVVDTMQKAAIMALGQAAASGAQTGHVDVVATVYRFDASGGAVSSWAPVGVFINTTDMAIGDDAKASFHTHVQFLPDASRQLQASAGSEALGR